MLLLQRVFGTAVIYCLLMSVAQAQTTLETQLASQQKRFSLVGFAFSESNLYSAQSRDYRAASSALLIPSYKISDKYKVSAITGMTTQHNFPRETTVRNTRVRLQHRNLSLSQKISMTPAVGVILPTNADSREKDRLRTGLMLEPVFLTSMYILDKKIAVTYRPRLIKNFHQFQVNERGRQNVDYTLFNALDLAIPLNDKIFFEVGGSYSNSWTYRGNLIENYSLYQSVSYSLKSNLIVSVGHSSRGNILAANGSSIEVDAFSHQRSTLYGQLLFIY